MIKYLFFAGIIYGIGIIGVAIARASDIWESVGLSSLLEDAMLHGLLWPATLIDWLA